MQRIVISVLVIATWAACDSNKTAPEDAVRAWAKGLNLEVRGVSCTGGDTDNDGYVSCIVDFGNSDQAKYQALQCAALRADRARGCKPDPNAYLPVLR